MLCLFFIYCRSILNIMTNIVHNDKSIDGVLGMQTLDHRMVGADESTDLLCPP